VPVGATPPPLVVTGFDSHEFTGWEFGARTGTHVTEVTLEFTLDSDIFLADVRLDAYLLIDEGTQDIPAITGLPLISRYVADQAPPVPMPSNIVATKAVPAVRAEVVNPDWDGGYVGIAVVQRAFWWDVNYIYGIQAYIDDEEPLPYPSIRLFPNFDFELFKRPTYAVHPILGLALSYTDWHPSLSNIPQTEDTRFSNLRYPLPYEFPFVTLADPPPGNTRRFERGGREDDLKTNDDGTNRLFMRTLAEPSIAAISSDPYTVIVDEVFHFQYGRYASVSVDLEPNYDDCAFFPLAVTWPTSPVRGATPQFNAFLINNRQFSASSNWWETAWLMLSPEQTVVPLWGDARPPLISIMPDQRGLQPDLYFSVDGVRSPHSFSKSVTPEFARWDVNVFWEDANLADAKVVIIPYIQSAIPSAAILSISDIKLTIKTSTTHEAAPPNAGAAPDTQSEQTVLTFSPRNLQRPYDPPPLELATGGLVSMDDGAKFLTYIRETMPVSITTYTDVEATGTASELSPETPWSIDYATVETTVVDPQTQAPMSIQVVSRCSTSLHAGVRTAELIRFSNFPTLMPPAAIVQNMQLQFEADAGFELVEHYIAFYLDIPGQGVVLCPSIDNGTQQAWGGTRKIVGPPAGFLGPEYAALFSGLLTTQNWGIVICVAYHDAGVVCGVLNNSDYVAETPITISSLAVTFDWVLPTPPTGGGGTNVLTPSIHSVPHDFRNRRGGGDARQSRSPSVGESVGGVGGFVTGVPHSFIYGPTRKNRV
jgi:hypothetical protein